MTGVDMTIDEAPKPPYGAWAAVFFYSFGLIFFGYALGGGCSPEPKPKPAAPCKCECKQIPIVIGDMGLRGEAHRHFAELAREKLAEELARNGLKGIGGDATPIPKDKIDAAMKKLSDGQIHQVGQVHAAGFYETVGDGGVLSKIVAGFKWLVQHPDIWVPIILKLLLTVAPFL